MAMVRNRFDLIKITAQMLYDRMMRLVLVGSDRKTYALWIQAEVPKDYQAAVFQLLSHKDIAEWVWKRTEEELVMESKNEVNATR
jgi:AAA+ superfamily predicted ATPase